MAEINPIGNSFSPASYNNPSKINTRVFEADVKPKGAESEDEKRIDDEQKKVERRKEELKDLVAVSKDGDTVQVSEDGREKLNDENLGRVVIREGQESEEKAKETEDIRLEHEKNELKLSEDLEAAERKREEVNEQIDQKAKDLKAAQDEVRAEMKGDEEEEEEDAKITSYSGYTDSQLEQLYLKGDISMLDYNKEISSREKQREASREEDQEFSNNMNADIAKAAQGERDMKAIDTAYGEDSNKTLEASDRLQFINAADQMNREATGQ